MVIRNIHFSLLIRIGRQLHEFNFRKRSPELYDADTSDERGNRHYFNVKRSGNNWEIEGKDLPPWINAHQIPLIDALARHESA